MKIFVLGSGAYGTALSLILNENNNNVTMWYAFEDELNRVLSTKECSKLPGIKIPDNIELTTSFEKMIEADYVLLAIPTEFVSQTLEKAKRHIKNKPIIIASKGIEQNSLLFINEIVEKILNSKDIAVLSGPSFAIDVAKKAPVGLTLACTNDYIIDIVTKSFCNNHFKLRLSSDIIGTEICGSIKNVMAIAAGILNGLGLRESTTAMFITESMHDIKRLIEALGGKRNTAFSFAGLGDLLLTSISEKSRNYSFGKLIGLGATKKEIDDYIANTTIEGLYTLKSIKDIIKNKGIDMPVIDLIYDIVNGKESPYELTEFLIKKY